MKTRNSYFVSAHFKLLKVVPVIIMVLFAATLNTTGQEPARQKTDAPTPPQRPVRFEVTGGDTVYTYTNEVPLFPGGSEGLKEFKSKNLKYPEKIKKLGIEGMIFATFIVEKNGTVSGVTIQQGVSPLIDAQAIKATKRMPKWEPGKVNGKPVRFRYNTNYDFALTPRIPVAPVSGEPFVVVEEMPIFPGGDSALLAFIAKNTRYPESARARNIEGRVILRFCITDLGGIDKVSVLKGVDSLLDNEAIRVVKSLPPFKPGKQGGKPVSVWYMVPITFGLNKPVVQAPQNPPRTITPAPLGYNEAPVFKGGEKALYKFINSNIVYPKNAKEKNISGKVFIRYAIDSDGLIKEAVALRGSDTDLSNEAIRVIKLLPAWKPGKLNGTPVKVWYTMPVNFSLK